MSMRKGASVSQLFALSSLPRGARMTRILSMRAGAVMGLAFRNLRSSAGSSDGLQSLALNDGKQVERGASWTLHAALPIRHQIARDVEIGGEHGL